MGKTTVVCSRCNKVVHGIEGADFTAGFYRRNYLWDRYFRGDETILCDDCMSADPAYQGAFPKSWDNVRLG